MHIMFVTVVAWTSLANEVSYWACWRLRAENLMNFLHISHVIAHVWLLRSCVKIKIKWHRYEWHFRISLFTCFLTDTCIWGTTTKKTIESLHIFVYWSEDSHGMKRVCSWRQRVTKAGYWGTPLGVPQYWFDQTWGKWAIIEGDNFFFINRKVALSGRIWSELPDSNADGCFQKKIANGSSSVRMTSMIW